MVTEHDCHDSAVAHEATIEEPYQYVQSGLSNVFLAGIHYRTCSRCGNQWADIPAIKELHRVIARQVVCQASPLTGEEIRFLRKRLGKPAAEFCRIIGATPETFSRWENEKQMPSLPVDRAIRFYYALYSGDGLLSGAARSAIQDALRNVKRRGRRPKIAAIVVGNHWTAESLAA